MVEIKNLSNNPNMKKIAECGCFELFEHQKDLSIKPSSAITSYFMQEMNLRKRQVLCNLNGNKIKVQAGAMQWSSGNVQMNSNINSVKGFLGKALSSAVTGESLAKPIYEGQGKMMFEPTYNYIIFEKAEDWGDGIVLDDGLFLACDATLNESIVARSNMSSALLGGEGLFNLSLSGNGVIVLESPVPKDELIEFNLVNDEVKIDGNMAIAWSKSLNFTVEKSEKSIVGSLVNGEGLLNVYRGTGKILLAPTLDGSTMSNAHGPNETTASSSKGIVGSLAKSVLDL